MLELRGYPSPEASRTEHYTPSRQEYYHHRTEYYPQPPSEYSTPSGHYADRLFPEFSSDYPTYAYDNPSSSVSSSTTASARTARTYTHRRTPSNVSNASSCGGTATSSINPTFRLEGEESGNICDTYLYCMFEDNWACFTVQTYTLFVSSSCALSFSLKHLDQFPSFFKIWAYFDDMLFGGGGDNSKFEAVIKNDTKISISNITSKPK